MRTGESCPKTGLRDGKENRYCRSILLVDFDLLIDDGALDERADLLCHGIVDAGIVLAALQGQDESDFLRRSLAVVIPSELVEVAREDARVELKRLPSNASRHAG